MLFLKSGHPGACLVYVIQGKEGDRESESYYERLAAYRGVGITSVPNTDESKMHLPGCRKQKHLKLRERAAQAVSAGRLQSRDARGCRGHQEGPEQAFPQHTSLFSSQSVGVEEVGARGRRSELSLSPHAALSWEQAGVMISNLPSEST